MSKALMPDHIVSIAKAAYFWGIPARHIAKALNIKESNIWNWANEISCARIAPDAAFAAKLEALLRGES